MGERRLYDRNFKEKAVQLGYKIGLTKGARELGIKPPLMTRWRQEFLEFGTASFCGRGNWRLNKEQAEFSKLKRKLKNELKESELKLEIFKSASKYISESNLTIYDFIKKHSDKYTITKMCKVLGTDKTTFDKWKSQTISQRQHRVNLLQKEITSIFYEFRELYGGAKITAELQSRGFKIKTGQVCIHMRKLRLVSKIRRNYRLKTNSLNSPYKFPNILNQQFIFEEPCRAWISDIARIQTSNGFLFVTIIMDLYDRKVIGWNLSTGLTINETTMPAWEMAVNKRKPENGLIFHSNRGIQYANKIFSHKLDSYKFIRRSMSRIGNHSDNAVSESFFKSFKSELVNLNMLFTRKQMQEKISEYFENL
ncbi:IS3 family transposase [Flavobacterium sp. LHD-85]|uniref:IS3 family transposase n=1 Tax=Flavobacterium sp. LHD-85 TaxID=3071410 RepID=UPI0027E17E97|nr:IS3 family transposase [Flavobacterium sp. LHD-85]MDQ6531170.1 IS3 family transposase [Flavobacterium sp. LHD-85]